MARVAWSFHFEASSPEDAVSKGTAWCDAHAATVRGPDQEGAIRDQVAFGVQEACKIAKKLGLETFFVELVGRTRPDPESRSGIGLGVFVSVPYPKP